MDIVFGIISLLLFGLVSYKKEYLTSYATLLAILFGLVLLFTGGIYVLVGIYVFFVVAMIATKVKKEYKNQHFEHIHEKSKTRDSMQVLANSLMAVILSTLIFITKNEIFLVLTFVVYAGILADTLSSEIGVLSRGNPFFLIGFKKIEKGISGGVSLLGLFASLIGSLIISLFYFLVYNDFTIMLVILGFGFLSSIFDSILGQYFQALYFDEEKKSYTEKRYSINENKKIKGFNYITNDVINFISPTITICLCYIGYLLDFIIV